jgi:hypothetical protein
MGQAATLFLSTFTTLLAIINPLESMPVFLSLSTARTRGHIGSWLGAPAGMPHFYCCFS